MISLLELAAPSRALFLSLYFVMFIALLFLLILQVTRLRCIRVCVIYSIFPLAFAFVLICLMEGQRQINMGHTPPGFVCFMGNLPWGLHVLILIAAALYSNTGFLKEKKTARAKITPDSIREALDNLPSGLCFSDHNGLPLLTNRRMYELAHDLDGKFLQNAELFWQVLNIFKERDGAEKIQNGSSPILRRRDGSIWRFSKTELFISDRKYIQTTAADITGLHRISEDLAESNTALHRQQRRLKKLIEGMIEITREEEILAVKVHIHNELGHCVLAGRRSLEESYAEGIEQALNLWAEVANRLEISAVGTTPNAGETLHQIIELAALLGCDIEMEGNLPKNEDTAYLLLTAVREAVTNAVRHAGASRVMVRLEQNRDNLTALITDNGTGCPTEIIGGGGLTSLRRRILQAGGEFNIQCNEGVSLHLVLPLTGEET